MILYFENICRETRREIGRPETIEEAYKMITTFLKEHDFVSYYSRYWTNPDNRHERKIDVGSHTEFFVLYNENEWE